MLTFRTTINIEADTLADQLNSGDLVALAYEMANNLTDADKIRIIGKMTDALYLANKNIGLPAAKLAALTDALNESMPPCDSEHIHDAILKEAAERLKADLCHE